MVLVFYNDQTVPLVPVFLIVFIIIEGVFRHVKKYYKISCGKTIKKMI